MSPSRSSFLKAAAICGVSALAITAADTAFAAETVAAPEEIVVTARKREENLMQTPVILQVLSTQQIKDQKINNIFDFAQSVPGFQAGVGLGPVGTVVYMRGIGSGDSASYVDQSVALNIDGI